MTTTSPLLLLGKSVEERVNLGGLQAALDAGCAAAQRRTLAYSHDSGVSYRDMVTLGSLDLDQLSSGFADLYEGVREVLSEAIDRPVHGVPDPNERYVLNVLDRPFDEQGWHFDSYAYAVNTLLETSIEGGALELALPGKDVSVSLPAGTWYALRTDTVRHRVTPLRCGRRVVLNLAYHSSTVGPRASYSSSTLYRQRPRPE